jgi:protocatechuate 3,4-dioxygenase alpha subunit
VSLRPTASQTVGPFFGFALPYGDDFRMAGPDSPGLVRIEGTIIDGAGDPVPDAMVEIRQADRDGRYPRPGTADGFTGLGRCKTDSEGAFHFMTIKPGRVPAPDGGLQAPHLVLQVFARGLLRHLLTRLYFPDEAVANLSDPVLSLIPDEADRSTLVAHDEGGILRFDIHLQGEQETVFFAH